MNCCANSTLSMETIEVILEFLHSNIIFFTFSNCVFRQCHACLKRHSTDKDEKTERDERTKKMEW